MVVVVVKRRRDQYGARISTRWRSKGFIGFKGGLLLSWILLGRVFNDIVVVIRIIIGGYYRNAMKLRKILGLVVRWRKMMNRKENIGFGLLIPRYIIWNVMKGSIGTKKIIESMNWIKKFFISSHAFLAHHVKF